MRLTHLRQKATRCFLSYRIILTYCMTVSFVCMHYFVSFSDFETELSASKHFTNLQKSSAPRLLINEDSNFNSKKLLNFNSIVHESALVKKLIKRGNIQKVYSSPRRNQSVTGYFNRKPASATERIKFYEPKSNDAGYNLKNKTCIYYSQILQDRILEYLINTTRLSSISASSEGLFVEAGAYDGETWSNTLYLEKYKQWTGVLVEPSVDNFRILKQKNRNAYLVNNCLCAGKASLNSTYIEAGPYGITTNVSNAFSSSSSSSSTSSLSPIVTCHPLTKILDQFFENFKQFSQKKSKFLLDVNSPDVRVLDYLSLDIEGSEKSIVETFRWDKYRFNFINIEYNQDKELYEWIKTCLKKYGYIETVVDDVWHQDLYLVHESVLPHINLNMRLVSQFVKHFS
jgi:hypothetical protein